MELTMPTRTADGGRVMRRKHNGRLSKRRCYPRAKYEPVKRKTWRAGFSRLRDLSILKPGMVIISLSGGAASSVAADRAISRYGRENVFLWFADTNWEDPDLYRFMLDCKKRWGGRIYRADNGGLTPPDIWTKKKLIPNNMIAPCSDELKIKQCLKLLAIFPKPLTLCLGMDWSEIHRQTAPKERYEAIPGVTVDFPLMWKPYESMSYQDAIISWGIEVPQMYREGFSHGNCDRKCCRQGVHEFQRTLKYKPAAFFEVADWERDNRTPGTPRENRTIVTEQRDGVRIPITLYELAERPLPADLNTELTQGDLFSCVCQW